MVSAACTAVVNMSYSFPKTAIFEIPLWKLLTRWIEYDYLANTRWKPPCYGCERPGLFISLFLHITPSPLFWLGSVRKENELNNTRHKKDGTKRKSKIKIKPYTNGRSKNFRPKKSTFGNTWHSELCHYTDRWLLEGLELIGTISGKDDLPTLTFSRRSSHLTSSFFH